MSFLKRWRASPTNLYGPDVEKAPVESLDLSGVLVSFKKPPHTAEVPLRPVIKQFDMLSEGSYDDLLEASTVYAEALLRTGWSFFAGLSASDSIGSLMLHIAINKTLDEKCAGNSLFDRNIHLDLLCQALDKQYSKWNGDMLTERNIPPEDIVRYKAQNFFQYPKNRNDFEVIKINNFEWLKYSVGQPGYPHHVNYSVALSHSNSLVVIFEPSRHIDDYFSPDTNLPEAVDKTINDIMNSMEIKLSPEAELQRKEALGDAESA
ncbi:conserved hypothetical protein [Teredinibacter turnerae T7901]|uniref:Uncharacterized protein n=1 Tax=Teredinibacter turnerae (strain ATCC 39867 / T7901) TaxID=377629 RepID=C5BQK0_TERTT|nr:hypothetical protein [Teredinibacter turnerae]ACR13504.1 conserved hypothetical protein [Teredinibacter turnerae T7901]